MPADAGLRSSTIGSSFTAGIRSFGYIDVLTRGPAWDTVRDRDRIDLVWVEPDRGLAKRMLKEPGSTVIYHDEARCYSSGGREAAGPHWLGSRLCFGFQLLSNRFRQLVG